MKPWSNIETKLKKIGVTEPRHFENIRRIRDNCHDITSLGMRNFPEYTLHNVEHSDNLIHLLSLFKNLFKRQLDLNSYEAYLLAASTYLHDLGMFIDAKKFVKELRPKLESHLVDLLCQEGSCDRLDNYPIKNKPIEEQIRLTHNLLGNYLLEEDPTRYGLDEEDLYFIKHICRGHRVANLNLRNNHCDCYRMKRDKGYQIRPALLALLLRCSDEFDFFANRAPKIAFQTNQEYFLQNPLALEHWLKHYLVADPNVLIKTDQYREVTWLECEIAVYLPSKKIMQFDWDNFFKPLFDKHINKSQKGDLSINKLPGPYLRKLGIDGVRLVISDSILRGISLPRQIGIKVNETAHNNVLEFLDGLAAGIREQEVDNEPLEATDEVETGIGTPVQVVQATIAASVPGFPQNIPSLSASDLHRALVEGSDEVIELSTAEYEGTITITRPVKIIGQGNVTFWTGQGPTIVVESKDVWLENLEISVTGENSGVALQVAMESMPNLKNVRLTGVIQTEIPLDGLVIEIDSPAKEEALTSQIKVDDIVVNPSQLEFHVFDKRVAWLNLRCEGNEPKTVAVTSEMVWLDVNSPSPITCHPGQDILIKVSLRQTATSFLNRRRKALFESPEALLIECQGQKQVIPVLIHKH